MRSRSKLHRGQSLILIGSRESQEFDTVSLVLVLAAPIFVACAGCCVGGLLPGSWLLLSAGTAVIGRLS